MADEVRRKQQERDAETLRAERDNRKRVAAYAEVLNRAIPEFARAAKDLGIKQVGTKNTLFKTYVHYWPVTLSFGGSRSATGFGYSNIGVRTDGSWIFLKTSLGSANTYEADPEPRIDGRAPTDEEMRAALRVWLERNAPRD